MPADDRLFDTVVAGGYCIGCGACAAVAPAIEMGFTSLGMYQASLRPAQALSPEDERGAAAVCPFSNAARNEDEIAAGLAWGAAMRHPDIGHHTQVFAGHVAEGAFRECGSSGGMGSWLACELLRLGLVDAVLHVRPTPTDAEPRPTLFDYAVSTSTEAVRSGAHSHYYPVTLMDVLTHVRDNPGKRYALIGVPCFIKAARLLADRDVSFAAAIRFHIGLVCGHLKSAAFATFLGWQAGAGAASLRTIDFRHKLPGRSPRHYGVRVSVVREAEVMVADKPMAEVIGGDWGLGYFKYKACDFCDDVFAETADVVIGDAWLPRFDHDWQGTNLLVLRHPVLAEIVNAAASQARLALSALSPDAAAAAQRSGLRHRREGLSWRLAAADGRGDWRPQKRVAAGGVRIPRNRRRLYEIRESLRDLSHAAFAEARACNDLARFLVRMAPLSQQYYDQLKPALVTRIRRRFARWMSTLAAAGSGR